MRAAQILCVVWQWMVVAAAVGADAPPLRSRAEVQAVLAQSPHVGSPDTLRPLHVVLVADQKDHGPGEHDYPLWQKRWKLLLGGAEPGGKFQPQVNLFRPMPDDVAPETWAGAPGVKVTTAWQWPSDEQLRSADLLVVFCYRSGGTPRTWGAERVKRVDEYLGRGGGLVVVHSATYSLGDMTRPEAKPVRDLTGLVFDGSIQVRHGPMQLRIVAPAHPICRGLPPVIDLVDEPYWPPTGDPKSVEVLATSVETAAKGTTERRPQPMLWTYTRGKGRVFSCTPGHFNWTFDDPLFRLLLLRGMAWAAGQSPYRFDGLALRGASFADSAGKKPATAEAAWCDFYRDGFQQADVGGWQSKLTKSARMAEGLRVSDPSTAQGSGRFYAINWQADPQRGATAEARLKAVSCSDPWGSVLAVSDGLHEEGVTFFPDRIRLAWSGASAPFDAGDGLHTYRVTTRGTDIQVWADDRLLIDGRGKFTHPAHAKRNQLGFGCASSTATGEAIWQWVRFRGTMAGPPAVAVPKIAGLDVELGPVQTIVPDAVYVSLLKLADGTLIVGNRRSTDAGRTWQTGPTLHVGACQLPDGQIVQLGFHSKQTARPGYFAIPLARSFDNGRTVKGEMATLHIPDATGGTGDDGKAYEGPVADHAIVRLGDGSLLAAMYGQFATDRVPVPTMPDAWKCYKYRTFVVRSTDGGRTWDYRATVAYDPQIGLESFCEADLMVVPGGDVLCFMRTGGSGNKYTPLYLSRSSDHGKTWSAAQPIADRGVWPNACRMHDGVLVCTYGRPGNWLAFSLDEGRTWGGHFCFYNGATTSYNTVEEVAPGKLLVVYDRQQLDPGGNMRREIVGQTVTVRRR